MLCFYVHTSARSTRKAFIAAFYLAVFFVVAQSACQFAHLSFPDALIRNNPGYQISDITLDPSGTRTPGTFSEPSFAGAFLLLYCVGFIAEYLAGKGSPIRVIVSLIATGLVASSGSLLALSVSTLALVVHYSPVQVSLAHQHSQSEKTWLDQSHHCNSDRLRLLSDPLGLQGNIGNTHRLQRRHPAPS